MRLDRHSIAVMLAVGLATTTAAAQPAPPPPPPPANVPANDAIDPRLNYQQPNEDTLEYVTPDATMEPLPLQVQRLRRENQDMRARLDVLEERLRSLITAFNTMTAAMTQAVARR